MTHPDVLFKVSQDRQADLQRHAEQARLAKFVMGSHRKSKLYRLNIYAIIRRLPFTIHRKPIESKVSCVSNPSHA